MWFFANCIRHEIQVVEKWMCPFQTSSLCSGGDEYGDPSSVPSASLLPRTLLPSPSQAQSLTHLQVGFCFPFTVLEVLELKPARNLDYNFFEFQHIINLLLRSVERAQDPRSVCMWGCLCVWPVWGEGEGELARTWWVEYLISVKLISLLTKVLLISPKSYFITTLL